MTTQASVLITKKRPSVLIAAKGLFSQLIVIEPDGT